MGEPKCPNMKGVVLKQKQVGSVVLFRLKVTDDLAFRSVIMVSLDLLQGKQTTEKFRKSVRM